MCCKIFWFWNICTFLHIDQSGFYSSVVNLLESSKFTCWPQGNRSQTGQYEEMYKYLKIKIKIFYNIFQKCVVNILIFIQSFKSLTYQNSLIKKNNICKLPQCNYNSNMSSAFILFQETLCWFQVWGILSKDWSRLRCFVGNECWPQSVPWQCW